MKNFLKNIFHIDHAIVAGLTVIIIELMVFIAINLEFLNPVVRAVNSFSMADIYHKIQNSGNPSEVCSTITIVDISELTHRKDIAQVIRTINEMKPSVLGVDIIFEGEKSDSTGDELLAETCLENISRTVFAYKLTDYDESKFSYQNSLHSYFTTSDRVKEGFVNLVDNPEKNVRKYANTLLFHDTLTYSFPFKISQLVTQRVTDDDAIHTINYKPVVFPIIKHHELDHYREYITGHIVLLGATQDERDRFYTPIGQKSGVEILAYTILSLTDGHPIRHASWWTVLLWALIAGYLTNLIDYWLTSRLQNHQSSMILFITQSEMYHKGIYFIVMVMITWISFELYARCGYFVDTVLALATIVLIEEGRRLYIALLSVLKKKKLDSFVKKSIYANIIK